jgi:hypothetical protein
MIVRTMRVVASAWLLCVLCVCAGGQSLALSISERISAVRPLASPAVVEMWSTELGRIGMGNESVWSAWESDPSAMCDGEGGLMYKAVNNHMRDIVRCSVKVCS